MSDIHMQFNCLFAIDKAYGFSSHDVCAQLKRILGQKRVGHAGTLDPAATGVLVVGAGSATRLLGLLTLDKKMYEAKIAFGTKTTTDDAAGEVVCSLPIPEKLFDSAYVQKTLKGLIGKHMQLPPDFSAISRGGKRAYEYAREGIKPKLDPRPIQIFSSDFLSLQKEGKELIWTCSFEVSKGTYIRSIARDLGESQGCAAHLKSLRRLKSGSISLDHAVTLEQLKTAVDTQTDLAPYMLDPLRALGFPLCVLTQQNFDDLICGRSFAAHKVYDAPDFSVLRPARAQEFISCVFQNKLFGIWQEKDQRFVCKSNFLTGIDGICL